ALVDPQIGHHRADPGADVALLVRIIAEREHGPDRAATGHVPAAFADEPDTVERAHGLGPGPRPLLAGRRRLVLHHPLADELLEPTVFLRRFCLVHRLLRIVVIVRARRSRARPRCLIMLISTFTARVKGGKPALS